ncbi:hypothetical protein AAVH_27596 [Aphelenchoides avenae]|nr:hypothetical protein AAVH_27596 [Aphelenchus avenae]
MSEDQAQRRLRLNYVVAELDAVLRELLADVPFVTEETLRSKYRQLCGKELEHGLDAAGMTLYDLVEMKFADAFLAVRGSKMPGILRLKFVNQPVVLAAQTSREDAGVQQVRVKAEPVAVSVDSHDSVNSESADSAASADGASDDGPPEPKRARMGEPEERGENAGDVVSRSGPVVVRVGPAPRVMSYFAAAQSLGAARIHSKNLEQTRRDLLRNLNGASGRVALRVFDFFELMKSESTLTTAEYLKWKRSGKVTCGRLSFGLKDLRATCVHEPDRVYTIVQVFGVTPAKHYVDDEKGDKISVKDLFEAKYGVRLEYPRQPIVVVDAPEGRREFVPMECVHVVEDEKLLFVSVLAARQATSQAIAAVYRVDFD